MSFLRGNVLVYVVATSSAMSFTPSVIWAEDARDEEMSFFEYLGTMVEKEKGVYLDPLHLEEAPDLVDDYETTIDLSAELDAIEEQVETTEETAEETAEETTIEQRGVDPDGEEISVQEQGALEQSGSEQETLDARLTEPTEGGDGTAGGEGA